MLFIDAHEMGSETYFFPPNADPVYHEIADPAVDWINDIYGAAMQDEFDERGIPYFNYDTYDLFYAGYGDTVPANGFGAAGMTFEKANGDPAPQRVFEQYLTQWTSLSAAAINKEPILRELARLVGRGRAPGRGRPGSSPTAPTSPACRSASRCPTARSATTSCARTTRPRRARCRRSCGGCSGWTSRCGG